MKNHTGVIRHRFKKLNMYLARQHAHEEFRRAGAALVKWAKKLEGQVWPTDPAWRPPQEERTETGRWAPTEPSMQRVPEDARAREVFEAVRKHVPFVHDVGTMQARLSFLFSDEGCEAHVAIPPRSPGTPFDYKALEERILQQLRSLTGKKVTVVLDEAHNLLALKNGWNES